MQPDTRVQTLLHRFQRRAITAQWIADQLPSFVVVVVLMEVLSIAHVAASLAGPLVAGSLLISWLHAYMTRPDLRTVARRIDARARTHELIVTALDCASDGMGGLVRDQAGAALARIDARDVFPVTPHRAWRQWLAGLVLAQLATLTFMWQAPAARTFVTKGASPIGASAPSDAAPTNRTSTAPPSTPANQRAATPQRSDAREAPKQPSGVGRATDGRKSPRRERHADARCR